MNQKQRPCIHFIRDDSLVQCIHSLVGKLQDPCHLPFIESVLLSQQFQIPAKVILYHIHTFTSVYKVYSVFFYKSREIVYNVYTGDDNMKPKKEIIVTFRTDAQTKALLDKMAEEKEWSVSQVVEKICKEYFKKEAKSN